VFFHVDDVLVGVVGALDVGGLSSRNITYRHKLVADIEHLAASFHRGIPIVADFYGGFGEHHVGSAARILHDFANDDFKQPAPVVGDPRNRHTTDSLKSRDHWSQLPLGGDFLEGENLRPVNLLFVLPDEFIFDFGFDLDGMLRRFIGHEEVGRVGIRVPRRAFHPDQIGGICLRRRCASRRCRSGLERAQERNGDETHEVATIL